MKSKGMLKTVCMGMLAVVCSCGHDSPSGRDIMTERPGVEGQRPGVGESNSMARELADDVWRVSGPTLTMRYDRGGILFDTQADGRINISDLDGADSVSVGIGKEGTDSLMSGTDIIVNGHALTLRRVKMLRHGDGRSWYMATDSSDGLWILVLPF